MLTSIYKIFLQTTCNIVNPTSTTLSHNPLIFGSSTKSQMLALRMTLATACLLLRLPLPPELHHHWNYFNSSWNWTFSVIFLRLLIPAYSYGVSLIFFLQPTWGPEPQLIFTQNDLNDVDSCKDYFCSKNCNFQTPDPENLAHYWLKSPIVKFSPINYP